MKQKEIQTRAEKIVDRFLEGYKYVVLDRNPESFDEPARTYDTLELSVDIEKKTIRLDFDSNISGDNAVEERQWNGIVRCFDLASSEEAMCAFDRYGLVATVEELLPLVDRIIEGGSVEWDGHNRVGVLDEDAEDAEYEIEAFLERSPLSPLETWAAYDYLKDIGVDAWPDGMTLDEAVQKIEEDADLADIVLVGDVRGVLLDFAYMHMRRGGECDNIQLREVLREKFGIGMDDPVKVINALYHKADMTVENIATVLGIDEEEVEQALENDD